MLSGHFQAEASAFPPIWMLMPSLLTLSEKEKHMDGNPDNPYLAPQAELLESSQPLYRLSAVALATFFGSPLAGAYITAHNLKAQNRADKVRNVWLLAIGILVASMVIGSWLPDGATIGLTVAQALGMQQYAKQLQGEALEGYGGAFLSNWRAFGISLLFLLAVIVALVPVVLLII